MKRSFFLFITLALALSNLAAQEASVDELDDELAQIDSLTDEPGALPDLGLGLDIGYVSLPNGDGSEIIGWQRLALTPDFSIGKIGVGLAVDLHLRFDGGQDGTSFEIRPEDWIPDENTSFFDIYLPKIRYIRYGVKGEPLHALFGSIDNGTLGNGFIVGGYRNTLFQPDLKMLGLIFDLDGALFNFPYVGFESFIPNLAKWDVAGARLYVRPIAQVDVPLIKDMQIGFTFVGDGNPHSYNPDPTISANPGKDGVFVWGVDFKQPVLANPLLSLAFFGDAAFQNDKMGAQLGLGGTALVLFDYSFAARFLGESFVPGYFDQTYDIIKENKYEIYNGSVERPGYNGWFGRIALNALEDTLSFGIALDGAFQSADDPNPVYPKLRADLVLKEGVVGDLSANAWYQKNVVDSLDSLLSPEEAVIGAKVGYRFGPAQVSLLYNVRYDPFSDRLDEAGNPLLWQVSSKLETSISILGGGK